MSADFWMNGQLTWDLYRVQQAEQAELKTIRPYVPASG
jgi:plasmid maintenance system antidote protein VapI